MNSEQTFNKSAASFSTLFDTISSSFFWGFCSICNVKTCKFPHHFQKRTLERQRNTIQTWRYKLICSVIRTEILRYFRLIFVPSVMNRKRKHPSAHDQIKASKLYCEWSCTESLSHSALKNPRNSRVKMNAAETITSTERCGPRLWKR